MFALACRKQAGKYGSHGKRRFCRAKLVSAVALKGDLPIFPPPTSGPDGAAFLSCPGANDDLYRSLRPVGPCHVVAFGGRNGHHPALRADAGGLLFLIFRPQRQQQKKRAEILQNIRRGDQIVLGGGIVGKVTKVVDDGELEAEIADGVRVRVVRANISEVRVKSEPVKEQPQAANKP